jgi:hypothetical protein
MTSIIPTPILTGLGQRNPVDRPVIEADRHKATCQTIYRQPLQNRTSKLLERDQKYVIEKPEQP